ncbi:MAG: hypothetical protein NPIRA04_10760 [Nitrospirales bacterium]|nr:MAG: hypothetical protein NPIRA04_10760 [Nitrospirales bacterium]
MMLSFQVSVWIIVIFFSSAAYPQSTSESLCEEGESQYQRAEKTYHDGNYALASTTAQSAVLELAQCYGDNHLRVASSLNTLGLAFKDQGKLSQAQESFEKALQIQKNHYHSDHPDIAESLTNLGQVHFEMNHIHQAQDLTERGLRMRIDILGSDHPDVAMSLNYQARFHYRQGQFGDANKKLSRALNIFEKAGPPEHRGLAMTLNNLGSVARQIGDLGSARTLIERSLALRRSLLDSGHPHIARTLENLSSLYLQMDNLAEARVVTQEALRIRTPILGRTHPKVAINLTQLARIERETGNFSKAKIHASNALNIWRKRLGHKHPRVANVLTQLAQMARLEGDFQSGELLVNEAIGIQVESQGQSNLGLAYSLTTLAGLLSDQKKFSVAFPFLEKARDLRMSILGPSHPDVGLTLFDLARLSHQMGNWEKAKVYFEQAYEIYQSLGIQHGNVFGQNDTNRDRKSYVKGLIDYERFLSSLLKTHPKGLDVSSVMTTGFLIAEQLKGSKVQAAIARALIRKEIGKTEHVELLHRVYRLQFQRQNLWRRLTQEYGTSSHERNNTKIDFLQKELEEVRGSLESALDELNDTFPEYSEVPTSNQTGLDSLQRVLRPDEALVSFLTLPDRLQIWLLRPDKPLVYREKRISLLQIVEAVERVRSSLVPVPGHVGSLPYYRPYDVSDACRLYDILFGQLESHLQGVKHLILAPGKELLSIPFVALLTNKNEFNFDELHTLYKKDTDLDPKHLRQYTKLPWMVRSYAMSVLPSTFSLKLLRGPVKDQNGQLNPFLGFGDPIIKGKTYLGTSQKRTEDQNYNVDFRALMVLEPLPDSNKELHAIASVLEVDPATHLFLRARATESVIEGLNASGELGRARGVVFATHALLASDLELGQPALVLSTPQFLTKKDDGLLFFDEVLQLKLKNTQWVILSACNTAASDGSGEGLSGLARAFFFAGTKSLVVSHWNVGDKPTKHLMSNIFTLSTSGSPFGLAEAMRKGILAVMDIAQESNNSYLAHPFAWAPFFVVGDGGRYNVQ